jgi:hypothetical protein
MMRGWVRNHRQQVIAAVIQKPLSEWRFPLLTLATLVLLFSKPWVATAYPGSMNRRRYSGLLPAWAIWNCSSP